MADSRGINKTPWPPDSYGSSVSQKRHKKLTRNVINICMEKLAREIITFDDELVGCICKKVGVSIGTQTMGSQIHFNPREIVISVMLKPEVGPEQFCTQETKYVTEGLRIVAVKPDSSRIVKIRMVGLYFNTPDSLISDYVECFGIKLVSSSPKMDTHQKGPWKGQLNGDRIYEAKVHSQKCPMGSYHLIDGARVKVIYPGNSRTCARCHYAPSECPGGGIARDCEAKGTDRVPLTTHLKQLMTKLDSINSENSGKRMISENVEDYIGVPLGAGAGGLGGGGGGDEGGDQASSDHLKQVDRLTTDSPPPPPSPSPSGPKDQPGLTGAAAGDLGVPLGAGAGGLGGVGGGDEGGDQAGSDHLEQVDRLTTDSPPPPPSPSPSGPKDQPGLIGAAAAGPVIPAVIPDYHEETEQGKSTEKSPETAANPLEQAAAAGSTESAVQASVLPAGEGWADEELDQMTKLAEELDDKANQ